MTPRDPRTGRYLATPTNSDAARRAALAWDAALEDDVWYRLGKLLERLRRETR